MGVSAENYDSWYYTEKGKYVSGLEKEVLLKMVAPVEMRDARFKMQDLQLIDIGCGTGYFTQFLGSYCRSIVGIDISMDMIKYAVKNHKGSNIKYLIANAENLPFKDGSFDMSVSVTAVNFFGNPAKSISEAVRISREKIFIGVLNKWSILFVLKKIKGFFSKTTYSNACFYSQREITNILSTLKFPLPSGERVRVRGIQKQYTYFFPFPRIRLILSWVERVIPSSLPFGGFMGIVGDK
jgi:ubiquinone/menaquinone biosynthesis C-methylase UbiE